MTFIVAVIALIWNGYAKVMKDSRLVLALYIKLLNGHMTMVTVKPRTRAGSLAIFIRGYQ